LPLKGRGVFSRFEFGWGGFVSFRLILKPEEGIASQV